MYYVPWMVDWPGPDVMGHMLDGENVALVTTRQTREEWDCLATRRVCGHKSCAAYEINSLFPLYVYLDPEKRDGDLFANGTDRDINFNPHFLEEMGKRLRLSCVADGTGDLKKTFGPKDVFHYIYAVLHSPPESRSPGRGSPLRRAASTSARIRRRRVRKGSTSKAFRRRFGSFTSAVTKCARNGSRIAGDGSSPTTNLPTTKRSWSSSTRQRV